MRVDTKKRKKATRGFEKVYGREKLIDQMFQLVGWVEKRNPTKPFFSRSQALLYGKSSS